MNIRHVWLRDGDVVGLIDAFVVSAATSLLLLRFYLFVSGYPQVGGDGLHIAHMVWGGLLMLVAIVLQISFITRSARWTCAIVGGVGFGVFVDEIGKFLTSDNNYFFKPAPAIIYGIFVAVYLFSRTVAQRRGFSHDENLANAIELLKEAAARDLDPTERVRATHFLTRAGDSDLAEAMRGVFENLTPDRGLSWLSRVRIRLERRYESVRGDRRFGWFIAGYMVAGAAGSLLEIAIILVLRQHAWQADNHEELDSLVHPFGAFSFVAWIEIAAALISVAFTVAGLVAGAQTERGLRWFERAIFVWVLVLQPFAFYEAQFFASVGLLLSLPILAVVQYALRRESNRTDTAPVASSASVAANGGT